MNNITSKIRIGRLLIDTTLDYVDEVYYLVIIFDAPDDYVLDLEHPTIRLVDMIRRDYNYNILKDNHFIPEAIIEVIRNNFYFTHQEEGVTSVAITLMNKQLDLSSLSKSTHTTVVSTSEEDYIVNVTEYYDNNGKVDIILEQYIDRSIMEDFISIFDYNMLIEQAIEEEDYESAERYALLRDINVADNTK